MPWCTAAPLRVRRSSRPRPSLRVRIACRNNPRATRLAAARLTFTLSIAVYSPTALGDIVPNRPTIASTRHSGMLRPNAAEYSAGK